MKTMQRTMQRWEVDEVVAEVMKAHPQRPVPVFKLRHPTDRKLVPMSPLEIEKADRSGKVKFLTAEGRVKAIRVPRECSSGNWSPTRRGGYDISLSLGTDPDDALLVVLHELAHHITRESHTLRFWRKAWALFHQFGVDVTYAHYREGGYKQRSLVVLHRMLEAGELPDWEPCCGDGSQVA